MLLSCLLVLYASIFSTAVSADDSITVRVGVYENQPKIFTDGDGNVSGFWVDIIEYIASEEGWRIEYVHGTWLQCLERLESNEIDILPDVGYTEERSALYNFSSETVLVSWSRVYTKEGASIQSILDLEGKTIAVLSGSINVEGPDGIKELVSDFDISCTFIEVDSYTEVFELLENKEADAGVTNKDFGNAFESEYNIERTPIIFLPSHIQFAFPEDSILAPYLAERIDYHIKELKEDDSSLYYQSLEKWLAVQPAEKAIVPGWVIWLLVSIGGLVLLFAGGSLILRSQVRARTRALTREIAERKQAEEALRSSEERWQFALEGAGDGVWDWDAQTNKVFFSRQWKAMLGFAEREVGDTLDEWDRRVHPDDKAYVDAEIQKHFTGQTPLYVSEHRVLCKDGSYKWILDRGKVISRTKDGTPLRIIGTHADITERKKAEAELQKLSHAIEQSPIIVVITDPEGTVEYVNPKFTEITGYSRREITGASIEALGEPFHQERDQMWAAMAAGGEWRGEFYNKKKNGERYWELASISPVKTPGGVISHYIKVAEDITERKKMEEQLVLTDRLASVGELASGIAHELNNPLTGVIGLSQLIIERELPEDVKEDLKMVYSEAQRAASVVKNLLTFARKHPLARQLIDINDIINKVLELRAYEHRLNNIQLVNRMAPDLPQIMADYFQLQQVFLNIIINAEFFMTKEHGKGTLTITTARVGDVIRASFKDDGPGIPKENLLHIFDPFFTTKEVGKGTGLGLSICHGIITAHGGSIYAQSEPGEGATFIVELPIKQEERQDE